MPAVLMIAYFFPPLGGVGVLRTLKFVKYLPEKGWQPTILSAAKLPAGPRDPDLLKEIPPDVRVIRSPAWLLPGFLPWKARHWITQWVLLVDEYIGWLPFAVRDSAQLIENGKFSAIYSTSSPYTDHLVALKLSKKYRLPWLADFRDPWLGNFSSTLPTSLHQSLAQKIERSIIFQASHVVVVSEPMKHVLYQRYPDLPSDKVSVIPNGYDSQDFPDTLPAFNRNKRFTLVYTGSLYGSQQRATFLLQGIEMALSNQAIPRNNLRLRFIGSLNKPSIEELRNSKLSDIIECTGFLPHVEAVKEMLAADVLILIIGAGQGSEAVFTGKIFEYLAAGRTILCLANPGAAASLVLEARAGLTVPPDDPKKIAEAIQGFYQDWELGRLVVKPETAVIKKYNRRKQTAELAELLDSL